MKTDINPNVYIEFLIKPHFEYLNSWTFMSGSLKHTKNQITINSIQLYFNNGRN